MTRRTLAAARFVLAALLLVLTTPVSAQILTGEIFGRVADTSSAVLPGVTVTLEGPALIRPEVATTTETGAYSFPRLPIGPIPGGSTRGLRGRSRGKGFASSTGFSAADQHELEVSTSPGTVTVRRESPVVDTRQTTTGATFTEETLQGISTARDPWVLLEQTPGVVMNQQNVGGNKSGQQSTFTVRGTQQGNSIWNVGYRPRSPMSATGCLGLLRLRFVPGDQFHDRRRRRIGANRRREPELRDPSSGGNTSRGSGRYFVSDNNYQSANLTANCASRALARATRSRTSTTTARRWAVRWSRTSPGCGAPSASRTSRWASLDF